MAQEIVDVSGQTGNQILQTLNKRGVQTSLVNLVQSTGAESARNIPRFIIVEDGQVKGGTDTQPQTEPQTAMDLKPADIVQETKIDRQPIPRQRPIVRNTVQQDLDTLELTDDSIKSALQQNLETIADSPGLTGLVDVGKEMLLDAAPEILPSVYSDEAKAQEPEEKISATDALIEKGGEVVKDLIMPEETEAEPNMEVAEQAIKIAAQEAAPVVQQTEVETVSETPDAEQELPQQISLQDINKLEKSGQITPKTKEAFDDYLEGGFEFFGNTAVIQKIDREIEANRVRLQEISRGEIKPFFGKEDTGKKIMAAIAAGLGAYASAITGGPNSALQIINDAIDRDLAIQKENLERQRMAIIDQNDFLQQQKADLLAYAELELDRMSTIAGTKNDALKDQLAVLKTNQELVINTNKIEKQEREENEYQFARNITLADGQSGEFNQDFSTDQIKGKKKDIMTFVEGYDVLMGAPTLAGRLALSLNVPSYSETYSEKGGEQTRKFGDKKLNQESISRVVDGVVITDDMIPGASSVDLTKRGIIDQLKELAKEDTVQIVAGGRLTPAGVKIMQLDTFLRNYYQRYIMVTGANLTGTEVTQVNDILPRPSKYAIASGNYLKGLEATKAALDSLYANRVLRYVKPRPQEKTRTAKPKSKLNQKDLKFAGDAS